LKKEESEESLSMKKGSEKIETKKGGKRRKQREIGPGQPGVTRGRRHLRERFDDKLEGGGEKNGWAGKFFLRDSRMRGKEGTKKKGEFLTCVVGRLGV